MASMIEMCEVTSANIFIRNSTNFDENGLFSERIFGPTKSYRCKCGKLNSSVLDAGKKCPKCEVYCISNSIRFEQHAYISLPFYALKPTKLIDLADLKKVIINIKDFKSSLLNTYVTDINIQSNRYFGINKNDGLLRIFTDKDYNKDKDYIYVPFRITGIFSLIFVLKYISERFNIIEIYENLFKNNNVVMTKLKVLPPGLRPISVDKKKDSKIHLGEINKDYISIINLNTYNKVAIDGLSIDINDWTERLDLYFTNIFSNNNSNNNSNINIDEMITEHIITEYDIICSRYQYYITNIYNTLFNNISGKEGFIRQSMLGKTIEFSARSVIICDPSLKGYEIKVSKRILYKLYMPYFIYYLVNIRNVSSIWCNNYITTNNDNYWDNKVIFDEFLEWFYAQELPK